MSATDLLQNLKEMFPLYYVDSDCINILKYLITYWYVTRREGVNVDKFRCRFIFKCVLFVDFFLL